MKASKAKAQTAAKIEPRLSGATLRTGPAPRSPTELAMPTRPPRPPKTLRHEREPRELNGFLRLIDGSLSFVFISFLLLAALTVWMRQSFDAPGPLPATAAVVIPRGEGALEIAERLEKAGVVADRRVFMLQYYVARFYSGGAPGGADRASLKAGEFEFTPQASVRQVLDTLISGRGILQKITIPEGLTSRQIVERLNAEPSLSGTIAEVPPEGALLPDTYKFSRGGSRQEIIDRMRAERDKLVEALWAQRNPAIPVQSAEQAVILASIVEKETGLAEERPRVAAVFVNRLRKGMRLQSDPTIIYGIVGGQGPLGRSITRSDIDTKTAYNTYQIDGLPPGPICNPGRASIAAVLNPPETQDLFFVADGTGGHAFTSTLKDHNAAVQNWRRIERARQGVAEPPAAASAGEAQKAGGPVAKSRPASVINSGKAGERASPDKKQKDKQP